MVQHTTNFDMKAGATYLTSTNKSTGDILKSIVYDKATMLTLQQRHENLLGGKE